MPSLSLTIHFKQARTTTKAQTHVRTHPPPKTAGKKRRGKKRRKKPHQEIQKTPPNNKTKKNPTQNEPKDQPTLHIAELWKTFIFDIMDN